MPDFTQHPATIDRRRFIGGATALAGAATLSGIGPAWAEGGGPVELLVVNSAVSGALKEAIEKDANCILNAGPFQTSTDVVARLNAPGGTARYDLMGSSFEFSRDPILGVKDGSEKVMPLDLSLIPNYGQLVDAALPRVGKKGDKTYLMPFGFGFDSVAFNADHVPVDDPYTQSWGCLFEDKYAGRIGWYDVAVLTMCAAGLYLGHAEPYKMDKSEREEVVKFLTLKKKNVRAFFTTFAQTVNMMMTGEIVVSYGALPVRAELKNKGLNVGYAFPKEGVMSLTNVVYIPKDAKNVKGAHAVINAMLGEAYASQLSKVSGYLSCSKFGPEMLSAEERKSYGYGILDGSVKHVGEFSPPNITEWIEGWARVKSA